MDRKNVAEMGCIAGIGGDVWHHIRKGQEAARVIALDGCPYQCVKKTLTRHGIHTDLHWDLSQRGVRKEIHKDYNPEDLERIAPELEAAVVTLPNLSRPIQIDTSEGNLINPFEYDYQGASVEEAFV